MAITVKKKGEPPAETAQAQKAQSPAIVHDTAKAVITKKVESQGIDDLSEEAVKISPVQGEVCRVRIGIGFTKNLGNYQTARFDVSLEVPCLHAEINPVAEFAQDWCDKRLQGMLEDD